MEQNPRTVHGMAEPNPWARPGWLSLLKSDFILNLQAELGTPRPWGWCLSHKPSASSNCSRSSGRATTRHKVEWWASQYLIILLITAGIISVWAAWKRWTLKSHWSSGIWLQTFIDREREGEWEHRSSECPSSLPAAWAGKIPTEWHGRQWKILFNFDYDNLFCNFFCLFN